MALKGDFESFGALVQTPGVIWPGLLEPRSARCSTTSRRGEDLERLLQGHHYLCRIMLGVGCSPILRSTSSLLWPSVKHSDPISLRALSGSCWLCNTAKLFRDLVARFTLEPRSFSKRLAGNGVSKAPKRGFQEERAALPSVTGTEKRPHKTSRLEKIHQ